jgi:hypothetical protein
MLLAEVAAASSKAQQQKGQCGSDSCWRIKGSERRPRKPGRRGRPAGSDVHGVCLSGVWLAVVAGSAWLDLLLHAGPLSSSHSSNAYYYSSPPPLLLQVPPRPVEDANL